MQQISVVRVGATGWQGDPLGIVEEIYIWPYEQMAYAQPGICPG